ncbi:MAG: c-type cytochrome [Verrucomicrobia bacterium]|nr:c-type cytochrome [Verrucomicrobiota bacterium]
MTMPTRILFWLAVLATVPAAFAATPEEYRLRALRAEGRPAEGARLFHDPRSQCAMCHTVDGKGGKAGPDLYAAGNKFSRADLIRSILEPSASIMMGYSTTVLELRSGEEVQGVLKSVNERELVLAQAGGQTARVAKSNIRAQRTSGLSLMPPGLQNAFSLDEFTDLIAYLESLKQPEIQSANEAATPVHIAALDKPVRLEPVFGERSPFSLPVWFGEHPTAPEVYLVVEQTNAVVWRVERQAGTERRFPFVNVRSEVFVTPTEGLLGFAFHPRFRENRKYYFMHEFMENNQRSMIIGERVAREDGLADSGRATRRVLRIEATTEVHHGGGLEFGPDGLLYIGMGDAGPQEDPLGHGQDLGSLSGKLLRIDVDRLDPCLEYGIPESNPFARGRRPGARPEIFAYGLRQPWRFSFDPANGDLWMADIGQDRFEEIGIVRAGENHGWNVYEGFELFSTAHRREGERFIPPIVSFRRKHGVSVTAGYLLRGPPAATFDGVYISGDFESRKLWGVAQEGRVLKKIRQIGTSPAKIVAFGQDRKANLYLVGYDLGIIYRIDFSTAVFE